MFQIYRNLLQIFFIFKSSFFFKYIFSLFSLWMQDRLVFWNLQVVYSRREVVDRHVSQPTDEKKTIFYLCNLIYCFIVGISCWYAPSFSIYTCSNSIIIYIFIQNCFLKQMWMVNCEFCQICDFKIITRFPKQILD